MFANSGKGGDQNANVIAVDSVKVNIVMADRNWRTTYTKPSVIELLRKGKVDLKKEFPCFMITVRESVAMTAAVEEQRALTIYVRANMQSPTGGLFSISTSIGRICSVVLEARKVVTNNMQAGQLMVISMRAARSIGIRGPIASVNYGRGPERHSRGLSGHVALRKTSHG